MRYIIIDHYTGYIWGDTADFARGRKVADMLDACRMLDESNGDHGRAYEKVDRFDFVNDSGFVVYRADIDGSTSDAVPVVSNGQNKAEIEAVERDCELLGYVAYSDIPRHV